MAEAMMGRSAGHALPVVLLPGMMCDARLFAPQIAALSQTHAVTVAPLRGGDRVEMIAEHILSLLPARFALAGLSMGGIVAMEILRRAPDRVDRLCLMNTTPLAETPEQAAWREPQIISARSGRLEDALDQALPASCLAPGGGRPQVQANLRQMGLDLGADLFVDHCRALQRRPDQQAVLCRAQVPSLILCGRHDRMTPVKRHEFMADLMPQAQLMVLEDAGHIPTLECPDLVSAALKAWMH